MGKTCTETELKDMIKEFDTDGFFLIIENWNLTFHPLGNGTIELSEFVTMMHQKKAIIRGIDIDNEDDMREYFKVPFNLSFILLFAITAITIGLVL